MSAPDEELFGPELALGAPEPLAAFNRAGVLSAADVHVALALGRLVALPEDATGAALLAVALAVRAPRLGHVFVDLASASETVTVEDDDAPLEELPWPAPEAWVAVLEAQTALVATGRAADDPGVVRPLRLAGSRLYLDRYWREERALAAALLTFAGAPVRPVALEALAARIGRLFATGDVRQRAAVGAATLRGLTVIAGGPGTGKTTAVARACAVLFETAAAAGEAPPLIALCAPTGKAAVRLQEAVRGEAAGLEVADEIRRELLALRASTIHRLLGWRPHARGRFRHDAGNRLPHDVVIVDETSMVSLTLMARLLEAIRTDARVVLVGDPDQLTAVEAGAVLRDIVGPATDGPRLGPGARALLEIVAGGPLGGTSEPAAGIGDGIVALERGHRFGAAIGALADAVRRGDGDRAVAAAVAAPDEEVTWIRYDVGDGDDGLAAGELEAVLAPLRTAATAAGTAVLEAARHGDGQRALAALGGFRLLCAHRHGSYGVATWSAQVERWLAEADEEFVPGEPDRPGRPLLITRNDDELRLYNGDTGVVIADRHGDEGGVSAAFERDGGLHRFAPSRLEAVETMYAMTIHKSQGSQFDVAAVLLPGPSSRLLSRELVYTAITRARRRLILICGAETLRAAVGRPVARATSLRERLWSEI